MVPSSSASSDRETTPVKAPVASRPSMNSSRSSILLETTVSDRISWPSASVCGCTSTSRTSGGSVVSSRLKRPVHENVRRLMSALASMAAPDTVFSSATSRPRRTVSASVRAPAAVIASLRTRSSSIVLCCERLTSVATFTAAQATTAASATTRAPRTSRSL